MKYNFIKLLFTLIHKPQRCIVWWQVYCSPSGYLPLKNLTQRSEAQITYYYNKSSKQNKNMQYYSSTKLIIAALIQLFQLGLD